jgi:hydrogenase small subunit
MAEDTIYENLRKQGLTRRDFLKVSALVAGAMGLQTAGPIDIPGGSKRFMRQSGYQVRRLVTQALETHPRLPVIWLEFQDCAGCSEALTRSHSPTLANLVLNYITVEYQETLSAAAGFQAEENKQAVMEQYAGQYVLVVEGSIPTGATADYCTIGGRSAIDLLQEAAAGALAIVATGNCSSFGGLPRANPNPTHAKGVVELLPEKTVINIPGCPAIPEVFTGTLLHLLVFGAPPELDALHRPKPFYGNTVHDRCLRRPFYESGRFAGSFDDEGARKGYCLYKLGCKGPTTYNSCATMKWDAGLSFPVQSGHPCLGCSQPNFWDGGGFYQGQSAPLERPDLLVAGAAAAVGAVAGAGIAVANRAQKKKHAPEKPE